jgi:hypothetical protein
MSSDSTFNTHEASNSRKGLLIAIAAALVLLTLAAYRLPLFHDEINGVVVGMSEVHDETGFKMIAAVQLETGAQVLLPMPQDLLLQESVNVRVNVGNSLFGRKSYRIIANSE